MTQRIMFDKDTILASAVEAAKPLKWYRLESGRYYARQGQRNIEVKFIEGNWHLIINGQFHGYYGRKRDAQFAIESGEK